MPPTGGTGMKKVFPECDFRDSSLMGNGMLLWWHSRNFFALSCTHVWIWVRLYVCMCVSSHVSCYYQEPFFPIRTHMCNGKVSREPPVGIKDIHSYIDAVLYIVSPKRWSRPLSSSSSSSSSAKSVSSIWNATKIVLGWSAPNGGLREQNNRLLRRYLLLGWKGGWVVGFLWIGGWKKRDKTSFCSFLGLLPAIPLPYCVWYVYVSIYLSIHPSAAIKGGESRKTESSRIWHKKDKNRVYLAGRYLMSRNFSAYWVRSNVHGKKLCMLCVSAPFFDFFPELSRKLSHSSQRRRRKWKCKLI